MSWPCDLLFYQTWASFKLVRDFVKDIIVSKFEVDWVENVASRVITRLFYVLIWWPTFWPHMTQFQTWLKFGKGHHCEQDWSWLGWKCGLKVHKVLWFDLVTYILTSHGPWASFQLFGLKMWHLECSQDFSIILSGDLLFDPTWPIFELDRDIEKMIILSKFDEDWTKTVASRVLTRFFYDLTYWPSFWTDITHIQTWPRYCQDDHSEQVWYRLVQYCGLYSFHNVFLWFDLLT